jgi:hypothetical protein
VLRHLRWVESSRQCGLTTPFWQHGIIPTRTSIIIYYDSYMHACACMLANCARGCPVQLTAELRARASVLPMAIARALGPDAR